MVFVDSLMYSMNVVVPVFLIVLIGFAVRKMGIVDDRFVDNGTKLTFKLALPLSIFRSIYSSEIGEIFNINLVVFAVSGIVILFLVLCLLMPLFIKDKAVCATVIQGIFRSNFLILGVPLAANMFGQEGLAPTTLLLGFAIPAFNLLAIVAFSVIVGDGHEEGSKLAKWGRIVLNILKNPLFLASVLGMLFSCFHIKLPTILEKTVSDIGSMATPLSLLVLGAQFDLKKVKSNLNMLVLTTLGRIVVVPLVVVGLGILLGYRSYELGAIFVLFSAPTAVSSYVMAENMGGDGDLAGQAILTTTFFSMFTITLGIYLLKVFGLI